MFDEAFPFFLMCGMSYEEFWYGAPFLASMYRVAHRLRMEQTNQQLWLQGLYIQNAVSVAINNAFNKKKLNYIKEPVPLFKPSEEEQKAKKEETRRKLVERLNAWKDAFDRSKGNGNGERNAKHKT